MFVESHNKINTRTLQLVVYVQSTFACVKLEWNVPTSQSEVYLAAPPRSNRSTQSANDPTRYIGLLNKYIGSLTIALELLFAGCWSHRSTIRFVGSCADRTFPRKFYTRDNGDDAQIWCWIKQTFRSDSLCGGGGREITYIVVRARQSWSVLMVSWRIRCRSRCERRRAVKFVWLAGLGYI